MRVQLTLEGDDYAALKALADDEDRGVAQQARHMLRRALNNSQREARAHEINAALAVPFALLTPRQAELAAEYGAHRPPGDGLDNMGFPLRDPQSVRPDASPDAKHAAGPEAVAFLQGEHQPENHDVTGRADGVGDESRILSVRDLAPSPEPTED